MAFVSALVQSCAAPAAILPHLIVTILATIYGHPMKLFAYKDPIWTLNGTIYQFDAAHFSSKNAVELTVTDDDGTLDGFGAGDVTQLMEARSETGALLDSGAGAPFFRYTMQTEAGDEFIVEQIFVGSTTFYIIPDIPTDGISFVIAKQEFVDGSLVPGLKYDDLPKYPCFAPGSMIGTPDGPRRVENLRAGDLVVTYDAGPQPLIWTGGAEVAWNAVSPHRPIILDAPDAPLTLSAQHRVLVTGPQVALHFGLEEAFAPAAGLARGMQGTGVQRWHHILCAEHQIVRANGLWVETLLTTPASLSWLPDADRARIAAILPDPMQPARACLTKAEADVLCGCAGTGSRAA